jgi:hypothetical protein
MSHTEHREETMDRIDSTACLPVELADRGGDGIDVRLLWFRASGRVVVLVHDERAGSSFELDVHPAKALDAFRHPFAYLAFDGRCRVVRERRDGTLVPA